MYEPQQPILNYDPQYQASYQNSTPYSYNPNINDSGAHLNQDDIQIKISMNHDPLNLQESDHKTQNYQNSNYGTPYHDQQFINGNNTAYNQNYQQQAFQQPPNNSMIDPSAPNGTYDNIVIEPHQPTEQDDADMTRQKCNYHWSCLIFTVFVWTFAAICLAFRFDLELIEWAWGILGMGVLGYYYDCKNSTTANYLLKHFDRKEAKLSLEKIFKSETGIKLDLTCYHMAKLKRYIKKNGRRVEEEIEVKRTTHKASTFMKNYKVKDVTGVVDFDSGYAVRLKLSKEFEFADKRSQELFEKQQADFIAANKKDVSHTIKQDFYIKSFKEDMLIIPQHADIPICFNFTAYSIFSAIGLSWFYRVWFDMKTCGRVLTIKKSFTLSDSKEGNKK